MYQINTFSSFISPASSFPAIPSFLPLWGTIFPHGSKVRFLPNSCDGDAQHM